MIEDLIAGGLKMDCQNYPDLEKRIGFEFLI